ncbi:hypothetical protein BB559_004272 [Furculomyces boomerangus]|uniref:Coatomer subunit epsilon n=2 Tax=Harpellales TaxID=61421 RepID=A0A2T9YFN7_9FUNG|nr:hypothetical protein BB559_004272 [Furculomyces boomerangus]PWA01469.1 hypothetical protein BB558_002431 [Smittium angustum]
MATILDQIRDSLYMGAYQSVINRATSPEVSRSKTTNQVEVKILMIRAYLTQKKFNSALNEINSLDQNDDLTRIIKNLAGYLQAKENGKTELLNGFLEDNTSILNENQNIIANQIAVMLIALVHLHQESYEEAMKLVALHPTDIECFALMVQAYLMVNRTDMAEQLIKMNKKTFEDSSIYQLAESWLNLGIDKSTAEKAFYSFEELNMSTGTQTNKLLNSQGVAKIHSGQFPEAEELFNEALDKDNSNADTLANSAISSLINGKGNYARIVGQIEDQNPNHSFLTDIKQKGLEFDEISKRYA